MIEYKITLAQYFVECAQPQSPRIRSHIVPDADQQELDEIFESTIARVESLLHISHDIKMMPVLEYDACRPVVCGYAPSAEKTFIYIRPEWARYQDADWQIKVKSAIAHEMHHNKRWAGPGHGKNLGEWLVTEGLAQLFEEDMGWLGADYATAIAGPVLIEAAQRAKNMLHLGDDENGREFYQKWFFGDDKDPEHYPQYLGYSLGYALVKAWQVDHPTQTAAAAVWINPHEILPYLDKIIDPSAVIHPDLSPNRGTTQGLKAQGAQLG